MKKSTREYVREAIQHIGGLSKVARICQKENIKVAAGHVGNWREKGEMPAYAARLIDVETKGLCSKYNLAPKSFGRKPDDV